MGFWDGKPKVHTHYWYQKERMPVAAEGAKEPSNIIDGFVVRYECKCGFMRYDRVDGSGLRSIKMVDNNGKVLPNG